MATAVLFRCGTKTAVAIGKPGATNAGILAAQILAVADAEIAKKLEAHKEKLAQGVEEKSRKLKGTS